MEWRTVGGSSCLLICSPRRPAAVDDGRCRWKAALAPPGSTAKRCHGPSNRRRRPHAAPRQSRPLNSSGPGRPVGRTKLAAGAARRGAASDTDRRLACTPGRGGVGARSCDIWSLLARSPSDNCAAKASLTLTMLTHGGRTLQPTVHQLVGMTDVTWRLVVPLAFCTPHFLLLPVDAGNCIVRGQWCDHYVHVTLLSFTTCNAKILACFVKHPL